MQLVHASLSAYVHACTWAAPYASHPQFLMYLCHLTCVFLHPRMALQSAVTERGQCVCECSPTLPVGEPSSMLWH